MIGRAIRDEFSIFERLVNGRPIVYLDSAASTPSPERVLASEIDARRNITANVHRGRHALSEDASAAYDGARRRVAEFIDADPRCVVFCRGTTEGLNLVAYGLGLRADDVVLTTVTEHHSNLVPWMQHAKVTVLQSDPLRAIAPDQLESALRQYKPKVFAFQHASNVTGVIQRADELCRVALKFGVISVLDAAQSVPHLPLDFEQIGCDFLCFSGHKMLGPKGIGVLCGRYELLSKLAPLVVGGGAVRQVTTEGFSLRPPPEGLEAGTPNVSGAIALAAAMDYLDAIGPAANAEHAFSLASHLRRVVRSLRNVTALCAEEELSLPIVSVVPRGKGITADQLATMLSDTFGVMVRSGLQCAHPLFAALNGGSGAIRASAYLYNTEDEISYFGECTAKILERFGA